MSSYAVIDFETANNDITSICQIGVVLINDDVITKEWSTLVKPSSDFNGWNTKIHGITAEHVKEAPDFLSIYDELITLLENKIVVSHGAFDKSVLTKTQELYGLDPQANIIWLDATRIVRNVLPQFSGSGYGLQNIAKHYSINTIAHDALNDAKTCAVIVNKLLTQSNTSINDWIELSKKAIKRDPSHKPINIEMQCNELGWQINSINAFRESKRKWSNGTTLYEVTPEEIAVEYLARENDVVSWCEGASVMLFLKACVLDFFEANHWLQESATREDAIRDHISGQLSYLKHRIDEIAEYATSISDEKLIQNISDIYSDEVIKNIHPSHNSALMMMLVNVMPKIQRASLLRTLSVSPEYSNGWPDITVINSKNLSFVEVKTIDTLKDSQISFALNVAKPNKLQCSVIKVVSKEKVNQISPSNRKENNSFIAHLIKRIYSLF